jgi:pantoate--beta-alanine ligase
VIKKLLGHLHLKTALVTCPTLREKDGLAMSSRNMRLSEEQRKKAPLIYTVLTGIKNQLGPGNVDHLTRAAADRLNDGGFSVEYVEIADASTLRACHEWNGSKEIVALAAAFLGEVRLIDNILLNN